MTAVNIAEGEETHRFEEAPPFEGLGTTVIDTLQSLVKKVYYARSNAS